MSQLVFKMKQEADRLLRSHPEAQDLWQYSSDSYIKRRLYSKAPVPTCLLNPIPVTLQVDSSQYNCKRLVSAYQSPSPKGRSLACSHILLQYHAIDPASTQKFSAFQVHDCHSRAGRGNSMCDTSGNLHFTVCTTMGLVDSGLLIIGHT